MSHIHIRSTQIDAARSLWEQVPSWVGSYRALHVLAIRLPDRDIDSCFLKVVAIDGLYNTFIYDRWGMAQHLASVPANSYVPESPDLVERLAYFGGKHYRSFASKYAHFFVDSERYPIWDQYVLRSLAHHRGSRKIWPSSYDEFCKWLLEVGQQCEEPLTCKEIDQYLWISGMYRQFKDDKKKQLSNDAKDLFQLSDSETAGLLQMLL